MRFGWIPEFFLNVEFLGFADGLDCGVKGKEDLRITPRFLVGSPEKKRIF